MRCQYWYIHVATRADAIRHHTSHMHLPNVSNCSVLNILGTLSTLHCLSPLFTDDTRLLTSAKDLLHAQPKKWL